MVANINCFEEIMIGRYYKYLGYVFKHKWYVFLECCKYGLVWRGLIHDMSKFRLSELVPYARFFYKPNGEPNSIRDKTGYYKPDDTGNRNFDVAWLKHARRNPHHWQYWVLNKDDGGFKTFEIPRKYVLEMVCDWYGASKAQKSQSSVKEWYHVNKNKMILHENTRMCIEKLIDYHE